MIFGIYRILKSIKRGWQGWEKNRVTPASIRRRAREYTEDELIQMNKGYEDFFSPKYSVTGFQKRVVDREMKKRNLKGS